jgi:hypothetical protein
MNYRRSAYTQIAACRSPGACGRASPSPHDSYYLGSHKGSSECSQDHLSGGLMKRIVTTKIIGSRRRSVRYNYL